MPLLQVWQWRLDRRRPGSPWRIAATQHPDHTIRDDGADTGNAAHGQCAECVVGVHGAAMTNLVFALPGTPVVELKPANVSQWIFGRLAQSVGLPYDVVIGTEPAPPPALTRFLVDADLRIDVGALLRAALRTLSKA